MKKANAVKSGFIAVRFGALRLTLAEIDAQIHRLREKENVPVWVASRPSYFKSQTHVPRLRYIVGCSKVYHEEGVPHVPSR